jgi:hypothetical protein
VAWLTLDELLYSILEVGALYHDLLFSYQRAQKLYHGPRGSDYVLHSALNFLTHIEGQATLEVEKSRTFEEAMNKLAIFLKKGKIIKTLTIEELDQDQYMLRVEGCIFAGKVHKLVNTKDVACPYAVIAMSIYNKFKGKAAKEAESMYFAGGTQTLIGPAQF